MREVCEHAARLHPRPPPHRAHKAQRVEVGDGQHQLCTLPPLPPPPAHPPHRAPVHKAQRVEVGDGQHQLCGVEASQRLVKRALSVQLEEEVAAVDKVQHQVELARGLRGGWVGVQVGGEEGGGRGEL